MNWRRALKQFQPSKQMIDISPILKAACLAPTSFGIQPFQIYVVTNSELKGKIAAAAYDQPQVDYS
jgi:nitroreductase